MPFAPDKAKRILDLIESGLTLSKVAEMESISKSLIMKYAREDEVFGNQYARSIMIRTEIDFENLVESVSEEPERTDRGIDMAWVQRKRLQVDTIKWALSKRNPKKYGDKLEHTGEVGIKTVLVQPQAKQIEARPELSPEFEDERFGLSDGRDPQ